MPTKNFYSVPFIIRTSIVTIIVLFCNSSLLYSQNDENDDEQEEVWNVSSGGEYYSRYSRYGIDLSENRSAFSIESEITHQSGLSAGLEAFAITGTNGGYEHSSFHGGYEFPLSSSINLHGLYTYHSYTTDSVNVLSGLSNELSVGGTLTIHSFIVSSSFTTYLGNGSANYLALGASAQFAIGSCTIDPSLLLCFASQTVSNILLQKIKANGNGKNKKPGATTTVANSTTISGLSNVTAAAAFHYPLGKNFAASVTPSYVYSPTDLSASSTQFIITIGIVHSFDF